MFKKLGLSRNLNHEELQIKGHKKRSTMGVDKKNVLSVKGHKEE
jgi:hypothetical protein